jgi:hypothetical protein
MTTCLENEERKVFAAVALHALLGNILRYRPSQPGAPADWHVAIAEESVDLADAMLKALKEVEP